MLFRSASTSSLRDSELSELLLKAAPAMIPTIRINTRRNALPPAAIHFPDVYKRQVHKRSIDDARSYFARIGTDIVTHLAKLSSTAEGLDAESRLQIFRDFFKGDVPQAFPFRCV